MSSVKLKPCVVCKRMCELLDNEDICPRCRAKIEIYKHGVKDLIAVFKALRGV